MSDNRYDENGKLIKEAEGKADTSYLHDLWQYKSHPEFKYVVDSCFENEAWIWAGVLQVLWYGAEKYHKDSWKKNPASVYWEAGWRHMAASAVSWRGETTKCDEESGFPHVWHWACDVLFALYIEDQEKK